MPARSDEHVRPARGLCVCVPGLHAHDFCRAPELQVVTGCSPELPNFWREQRPATLVFRRACADPRRRAGPRMRAEVSFAAASPLALPTVSVAPVGPSHHRARPVPVVAALAAKPLVRGLEGLSPARIPAVRLTLCLSGASRRRAWLGHMRRLLNAANAKMDATCLNCLKLKL